MHRLEVRRATPMRRLRERISCGYRGTYAYLLPVEMSGFALGNVVYIILEIQYQMTPSTVTCSGTYGWTFVFRLAFIVAQTFFLFKNQTVRCSPLSTLSTSRQRATSRRPVCVCVCVCVCHTRELNRHGWLVGVNGTFSTNRLYLFNLGFVEMISPPPIGVLRGFF